MQRLGRVLTVERAASAMDEPKTEAMAPAMAARRTVRREALRPTSLVRSSKRRSSTLKYPLGSFRPNDSRGAEHQTHSSKPVCAGQRVRPGGEHISPVLNLIGILPA